MFIAVAYKIGITVNGPDRIGAGGPYLFHVEQTVGMRFRRLQGDVTPSLVTHLAFAFQQF
jgi:hypothetical protein